MKQKVTNLLTNIIETTIILITIIAIICFVFGVLSLDSPNTATPEIMLVSSLAWIGLMIKLLSR